MKNTSGLTNTYIAGLIIMVFLVQCQKEDEADDGWENCLDCTVTSWVGEFYGTGDYFDYATNSTIADIQVSIIIEETSLDYLTVYFTAPNFLSANISGSLVSNYIISFAGTGSSVTATLSIKGKELKLYGNTRKFHSVSDSLVMDKLVNFEVFKLMNKTQNIYQVKE